MNQSIVDRPKVAAYPPTDTANAAAAAQRTLASTRAWPVKMLRASAVAEILDLPLNRVYALARDGVIPHARVGRSIRFNSTALAQWLESGGASLEVATQ